MERTPENIREFREKAVEYITYAIRSLNNIGKLCTEEGYDSDDGEYMGWFNKYLLPEYNGQEDAYPFNLPFDEQIIAILEWRDSILEAIEEEEE